jgi:hypothetical protein
LPSAFAQRASARVADRAIAHAFVDQRATTVARAPAARQRACRAERDDAPPRDRAHGSNLNEKRRLAANDRSRRAVAR